MVNFEMAKWRKSDGIERRQAEVSEPRAVHA